MLAWLSPREQLQLFDVEGHVKSAGNSKCVLFEQVVDSAKQRPVLASILQRGMRRVHQKRERSSSLSGWGQYTLLPVINLRYYSYLETQNWHIVRLWLSQPGESDAKVSLQERTKLKCSHRFHLILLPILREISWRTQTTTQTCSQSIMCTSRSLSEPWVVC